MKKVFVFMLLALAMMPVFCEEQFVLEEWYEYDSNGNRIYSKTVDSDGHWSEWRWQYDSNGNMIYEKVVYSNGHWSETRHEYDSNGKVVYVYNSWTRIIGI